jgi:peptidyl-prolyl cis-trans isomerase C
MKKCFVAAPLLAASIGLLAPLAAMAQNVAIVNGKAVPKSRVDTLMTQVARQGQQATPELERQVRDEVVMREIFMQEAVRRGITAKASYRNQMELARQTITIRELFTDYQEKNKIGDAEVMAEYDKLKSQNGEKEYRARHILVEQESEAKDLIAQIKGGAKFEDLAKKSSKDPGSAQNGGDLDWATPGSYVREFSEAMAQLSKGGMTETPVKSQFGWHVIKLEDVRDAQFPPVDEVKPQILQRLQQAQMTKFRDEMRAKAKTDYKFSQ